MFENIMKFFKKLNKKENKVATNSKEAAKERLHLVLMQDRANVSADFLELMKQEIIEVIKKYIDVDENAIDVRLTNKENGDGTNGAPALYANIPIINIKNEARKAEVKDKQTNKKIEKVKKEQKEEPAKTDNKKTKEVKKVKKEETKPEQDKIEEISQEDVKSDKRIEKVEKNIETKDKVKSED